MNNTIISICREYCSGGKEIGKKVSDELGYTFLDKQLITEAAKKSGYDESVFEKVDEVATNSLLYSLVLGTYGANAAGAMPDNDKLFGLQAEIIRDTAKEKNCVVIGRCADYVLREEPHLIKIFLKADMDFRAERFRSLYTTPEGKKPEDIINKTDKKRASYYKFYTGNLWKDMNNYDLVINTGKVGIDNAVATIIDYVRKYDYVK